MFYDVIEYDELYDGKQCYEKLDSQYDEKKYKSKQYLGVSEQVDPRTDIAPMGTLACDPT